MGWTRSAEPAARTEQAGLKAAASPRDCQSLSGSRRPAGCRSIHSFPSDSFTGAVFLFPVRLPGLQRLASRHSPPPALAPSLLLPPSGSGPGLTSSPFLSVFLPGQKRWAQVLTARPWSGFFRSLEAASAHCVLSGSWFSSPKHFILSNVPMISVMAASWALESLISSSYRENAWWAERGPAGTSHARGHCPCRSHHTPPSGRPPAGPDGRVRPGEAGGSGMLTGCSRKAVSAPA